MQKAVEDDHLEPTFAVRNPFWKPVFSELAKGAHVLFFVWGGLITFLYQTLAVNGKLDARERENVRMGDFAKMGRAAVLGTGLVAPQGRMAALRLRGGLGAFSSDFAEYRVSTFRIMKGVFWRGGD